MPHRSRICVRMRLAKSPPFRPIKKISSLARDRVAPTFERILRPSRDLFGVAAALALTNLVFCTLAVALDPMAIVVRRVSLPVTNGHDIRFKHLSTEQGLSQSTVHAITQDDHGLMWFGTHAGLNRFDGYTVKTYMHDPGNPNSFDGSFITALFKDRAGMLWVGVDRTVDRFDPDTEVFTHFQRTENGEGLSGSVTGICQDKEGYLWLATNNGLDKLDPKSGHFAHYRHDPEVPGTLAGDDVRAVSIDKGGTLWTVTASGVDALPPGHGEFIHYGSLQLALPAREAANVGVYEDRSGTIWLNSAMGNGLASFDPQTRIVTVYKFQDNARENSAIAGVNAVLEDQDGLLWIGTVGGGVVKFDRKTGSAVRYRNDLNPESLSNDFEDVFYQDREGNMWVGNGGGGVDRFSPQPSPFVRYRHEPGRNSLDQSFILSAFKDSKGILWVGTDGVLNRIDPHTGQIRFYRHQPDASNSISSGTVSATVEDQNGILWFGTWDGGLNRHDPRAGKFRAFRHDPADPHSRSRDSIHNLLLDHAGVMWIATSYGLDRFDQKSGQFTFYPLNAKNPPTLRAVVEDDSHALWIGTFDEGLYRLDPLTGATLQFTNSSASSRRLSDNRVNSLLVDSAGKLWVGTQNGLDEVDPKAQSIVGKFSEKDGLSNNSVQGILQDHRGYLWVSTIRGLSRFDTTTREFRHYYGSDGLAGDEFNYFGVASKARDGEMFFGGVKGLTSFYPDRVRENSYSPPVVITELLLFNVPVPVGTTSVLAKSISSTQSITLNHKQSIFSLEFSALSYADPQRNRYRYRLEGLETKWNETASNRRFVTYTTLAPGDYTFHVQGSNNHGVWNESGTALRITILPPWWNTWSFRLFATALVLFSASFLYHVRVRGIEKRNRELVEHNQEMQRSQCALQQSEELQRRLNRELRAISNCNEALIRAVDEQVLLDEICRIVCDDAGYRMVWVGYVEHDQAQTVRPVAWAGVEEGYLSEAALTWADTDRGAGPAGTAVRQEETSYTQDISTSPAFARWRASALQRGYRSVIAFPLKNDKGSVFGVMAIYSAEVDAFTSEEIRLLEELADDLAFGIMVLRGRIEHRQTEYELHRSEKKYRTFFGQNLAGNYICSPEGTLLACNPAFLRMFGYASEFEATQTNVVSLYPDPAKRQAFLQQLREQYHVSEVKKEFRRKDGAPLYVSENAIGTFDERGELIEIHGFLIDETERISAEQQLRQAQKMEMLGKLSGGIAHDFNNILAIINGYSELLLGHRSLDAVSRHDVQEILHAGQQAALLTRQLLAFSRKQVLQPKVLNLDDVIRSLEKMLARLMGDAIEVDIVLQPDLRSIEADPGQLEQIILNLCVNARDAMTEGGSIRLETKNVDIDGTEHGPFSKLPTGCYVSLAVTDTGTGMDTETLSHIFEPFFTTKGTDQGTGLGLATVHSIVKQIGGDIKVESKPGRGSTFYVYLPSRTRREIVELREHTPQGHIGGAETILLVDDASALRAILRSRLEANGYTVLEADDGEHAIRISGRERRRIDLLLTDISMPKMNGPSLAKRIIAQRPQMKVLYMSGYANPAVAGVVDSNAGFLQKPFSEDELTLKVREILDS